MHQPGKLKPRFWSGQTFGLPSTRDSRAYPFAGEGPRPRPSRGDVHARRTNGTATPSRVAAAHRWVVDACDSGRHRKKRGTVGREPQRSRRCSFGQRASRAATRHPTALARAAHSRETQGAAQAGSLGARVAHVLCPGCQKQSRFASEHSEQNGFACLHAACRLSEVIKRLKALTL